MSDMKVGQVKCPVCRGGRISVAIDRETELSPRGRRVSFSSELSVCDDCKERFFTIEQSLANSRAHARAVQKMDGLLTPEQIVELRMGLGYTQEQFEKALGVGKKTVVRWERGTVVPNVGTSALLWFAAKYPKAFQEYAREVAPEVEPREREGVVIANIESGPTGSGPPMVTKFGPTRGPHTLDHRDREMGVLS